MKIYIIVIFLFSNIVGFALLKPERDTLFVAFWNLENLYDTLDDPFKDDAEFLPDSKKDWTGERFSKKLFNLARIIRSMNFEKGPDILGICESENEFALTSLINKNLKDMNYEIAYRESPDRRGIDVALIVRKDKFKLISIKADTVILPDNYPTRLILNVKLKSSIGEIIDVFVNHWPSRRGGVEKSEKNRIAAAEVLKRNVDVILKKNPEAKIIIMGDFNDEPSNISINEVLDAKMYDCNMMRSGGMIPSAALYNLSSVTQSLGMGSYKFQDQWNMIDQIIISGGLISNNKIEYLSESFHVYKNEIMVTHSGKYEGAPFPTFGGDRYLGGYSDHFPVVAKFLIRK
jgi:endonuclease/exonuclease/phosphatase family metal-dependent hydrolase